VKNLAIIRPKINEGVYGAYRYAFSVISKMNFSHLLLLDQDSFVSRPFLETSIRLMSNKKFECCVFAPFDSGNLIKNKALEFCDRSAYSQLVDAKGSGLILPKELCIAKFLDPRLYLDYLDWSFCWKLTSFGYKIYHIDFPLARHSLGSHFKIPFSSGICFRISSPARLLNQLTSSTYLLFSPQYYTLMPTSRRVKLCFRTLCIPFLFLISFFFHQFSAPN
tara:strand:+ start:3979 stop:4641 length:663 start_codon:yes stop_codon:yes gene_type:complete